jgi:hypothetical protein
MYLRIIGYGVKDITKMRYIYVTLSTTKFLLTNNTHTHTMNPKDQQTNMSILHGLPIIWITPHECTEALGEDSDDLWDKNYIYQDPKKLFWVIRYLYEIMIPSISEQNSIIWEVKCVVWNTTFDLHHIYTEWLLCTV